MAGGAATRVGSPAKNESAASAAAAGEEGAVPWDGLPLLLPSLLLLMVVLLLLLLVLVVVVVLVMLVLVVLVLLVLEMLVLMVLVLLVLVMLVLVMLVLLVLVMLVLLVVLVLLVLCKAMQGWSISPGINLWLCPALLILLRRSSPGLKAPVWMQVMVPIPVAFG